MSLSKSFSQKASDSSHKGLQLFLEAIYILLQMEIKKEGVVTVEKKAIKEVVLPSLTSLSPGLGLVVQMKVTDAGLLLAGDFGNQYRFRLSWDTPGRQFLEALWAKL